MTLDLTTLAGRLTHARKLKGWTQAHLAVVAGVSTGTIGNIESAVRGSGPGIPLPTLPQIAKALGVRYEWLAHHEEPMTPPAITRDADGKMNIDIEAINRPRPLPMSPETEKRLTRFLAVLYQLDDERRGGALLAATETLLDHLPLPPTA